VGHRARHCGRHGVGKPWLRDLHGDAKSAGESGFQARSFGLSERELLQNKRAHRTVWTAASTPCTPHAYEATPIARVLNCSRSILHCACCMLVADALLVQRKNSSRTAERSAPTQCVLHVVADCEPVRYALLVHHDPTKCAFGAHHVAHPRGSSSLPRLHQYPLNSTPVYHTLPFLFPPVRAKRGRGSRARSRLAGTARRHGSLQTGQCDPDQPRGF
jgi:hypothetical protein